MQLLEHIDVNVNFPIATRDYLPQAIPTITLRGGGDAPVRHSDYLL